MAFTQDGVTYQVTVDYVHSAGTNCQSTAAQVQEHLAALRTYVVSLEDSWKGVAAGQFQTLMQEYDSNSALLQQSLGQIGAGLIGSGSNYSNSEQANFTNLAGVSLPKANLS